MDNEAGGFLSVWRFNLSYLRQRAVANCVAAKGTDVYFAFKNCHKYSWRKEIGKDVHEGSIHGAPTTKRLYENNCTTFAPTIFLFGWWKIALALAPLPQGLMGEWGNIEPESTSYPIPRNFPLKLHKSSLSYCEQYRIYIFNIPHSLNGPPPTYSKALSRPLRGRKNIHRPNCTLIRRRNLVIWWLRGDCRRGWRCRGLPRG